VRTTAWWSDHVEIGSGFCFADAKAKETFALACEDFGVQPGRLDKEKPASLASQRVLSTPRRSAVLAPRSVTTRAGAHHQGESALKNTIIGFARHQRSCGRQWL